MDGRSQRLGFTAVAVRPVTVGRRTSADFPPVIGESALNDRGKAVSIVRRNH